VSSDRQRTRVTVVTKSSKQKGYIRLRNGTVKTQSELNLYKDFDMRTLRKLAADQLRPLLHDYAKVRRQVSQNYKRDHRSNVQRKRDALPYIKRRNELQDRIERLAGTAIATHRGSDERLVGES